SSTLRLCCAARAAPKFTVVVVFPTPPFCAVIATMVAFLLPLARCVSDEPKRFRLSRSRFLIIHSGEASVEMRSACDAGLFRRLRAATYSVALWFVRTCQRQFLVFKVGRLLGHFAWYVDLADTYPFFRFFG